MGPVKYAQKFRKDWLQDPKLKDWLLEVPGDCRRARCRYCRTELSAKHVDLVAHAATKKHVSAAAPFSSGRQTTLRVERKSDRSRTAEGSLAMFICAHSAMLASDHLGELCRNQFRDSEGAKHLQLHRSKCSALIKNVLSPHFVDELLSELGSRRPDPRRINGHIGDQAVGRRYRLLQREGWQGGLYFSELSGTHRLESSVHCRRSENVLSLASICRGWWGTDNASVMVGVNNGVYQKLKADVPNLLLVRCVCHSLNLAVSSAVAEALPKNLEFLVSEIYNWFSQSPSRQQSYRDLYRALYDGHDPLKIVQSCSTRWLSSETAVRRVLDQWEALNSYFGEARMSEKCYSAELLHSMIRDPTNLAYLVFVKPILSEVQRVNKAEFNSADSLKLLSDLTPLTEGLTIKLVLPTCQVDPLSASVDAYVDPRANLGYEVERTLQDLRKTGFSGESERVFRERCIAFLYHLVRQLQQRLPDNVRTLRQVSLLSVGNALCAVKESLVPLMEFIKMPQEKIAAIELQWDKLTLVCRNKLDTTVAFWDDVKKYRDASNTNPFLDLADFALATLVLPWSNAKVERVFSQRNIVRSKQRNRMSTEMTTAILTVRAGLRRENKCCPNYKLLSDVVRKIGTMEATLVKTAVTHQEPVALAINNTKMTMKQMTSFYKRRDLA